MESLDAGSIRVDPASTTPPFEQVRAHIAGLIAEGALPPGTKLPTVRRLAVEVNLAVNTAARVYRELESDSLVVTEGRRGTFVNSSVIENTSGVAVRARDAADDYIASARRLGLTRSEAVRLVERQWDG